MFTKEREELYIEPFRGEGSTKLGVLRLNYLAYPDKQRMKIMIGDTEFKPIGFDTYGHPIISQKNYEYCDALKAIAEREGKFLPIVVEYDKKVFCIRKEVYDSVEGIKKALGIEGNDETKIVEFEEQDEKDFNEQKEKDIQKLKRFKELLIDRKQAAFNKEKLNTFILFGRYVLTDNGHIFECEYFDEVPVKENEKCDKVLGPNQFTNLILGKEVHIPSENDVCAVCGKNFNFDDIENLLVSENEECEKVHTECYENCIKAINHERASQIIDAVYTGKPKAECKVGQIHDPEDNEMKTCYIYKTMQGTITIYFRRKVTVIVWHDNFKPFNMSIFDNERVTKFDRGIHAWSNDDAIRYLSMAKKA